MSKKNKTQDDVLEQAATEMSQQSMNFLESIQKEFPFLASSPIPLGALKPLSENLQMILSDP